MNGCRKNSSLKESEIESLTDEVSEVFLFTFQKAHSLSYSTISYWGAYYKTHFRTQFDKAFQKELKF